MVYYSHHFYANIVVINWVFKIKYVIFLFKQ